LAGLLLIDLAFSVTSTVLIFIRIDSVTSKDFQDIQITLLVITLINTIVYVSITTILVNFFKKHYNNRFDCQIKPIKQVCFLLALQSFAVLANQTLLYYFTVLEKHEDSTQILLRQIEETIVPYFSILLPSALIFYQHRQVFKKEEDTSDTSSRHGSLN
jgi:amino acid transporter